MFTDNFFQYSVRNSDGQTIQYSFIGSFSKQRMSELQLCGRSSIVDLLPAEIKYQEKGYFR